NWWLPQIATIRAQQDNIRDGDQPFDITVGQAVSADPHYIGRSGSSVHGVIVDSGIQGPDALSVSGYVLESKQYSWLLRRWTYRYRVVMNNEGPRVNAVSARI